LPERSACAKIPRARRHDGRRKEYRMSPTFAIVMLWVAFAATHVGLSSLPVRQRLVTGLGAPAFQGLYSVIALAIFVPLVWTYFAHKHAGPLLWSIPIGTPLRWLVYVAMAGAFILMVAGLVKPSLASMVPGDPTPRGAQRLTRHPLFMGLGIFGLLHLIPNGNAADVAFFGGFPIFAVVGCWHQDRRKLTAGPPEYPAYHRATPFLPFTGRDTVRGLRELGFAVIAGGVGITWLLRYFHPSWFGG
jgi:uncharacterized membrane protein